MRRLSIGRLIAVIFSVTVVLLFSIDTTSACRFLWRSRCYTPVYCCPPACDVTVDSSCCSDISDGHAVDTPTHEAPTHDHATPADPAPADSAPTDSAPADSAPTDSAPADSAPADPPEPTQEVAPATGDAADVPATEAGDQSPTEDAPLPGDEPALDLPADDLPADDLPADDLPADDSDDLSLFDEPATDDAGTGDSLPPMPEDDILSDPLPDDSSEDEVDIDALLPADEDELPADDDLPAVDPPADSNDDDLDDLFGESKPAENGDERVANNPEDEGDDLFDDVDIEVDIEEPTDSPADSDDTEDLFPADDADDTEDLFPTDDADELPGDSENSDDDLDDLFGQAPATHAPANAQVTTPVKQPKTAPLFRVWTDDTGSYQTVGRLVKISNTHVRLLKDNGRFSTVSKRRLSESDLAYVQRMAKQMGIETIEQIASR